MIAAALAVAACGSDSKSDVSSRADMGGDAGATSDGSDEAATDADTGEETTDESAQSAATDGSTDATTSDGTDTVASETDVSSLVDDAPPAFEPPDPILPDEDPDTPVEELSDGDFEQVCDAYLQTSGDLFENYAGFCGVQAITEAEDSGVTDTEEYRAVCAEALAVCENQAATVVTVVDSLECVQDECTATVGEFDACRTQIAALDAVLFEPLSALDAPSCDEVTPAIGAAFSLRVAATALVSLAALSEAEGGSILSDESPCDSITEQCPDFAVPVGADLFAPGGDAPPDVPAEPAADAGAN